MKGAMKRSTTGKPERTEESPPPLEMVVAYRLVRRGPGLVIEAYDVTGQEPAHRTEPEIAAIQRARVEKLLRRGVQEDAEALFRALTGGDVA